MRPTPGKDSRAFLSEGTSPSYFSIKIFDNATIFFALELYRPIVLIKDFKPNSLSLIIASGVLADLYSLLVALLTLTSVACADNTTATKSSKLLL